MKSFAPHLLVLGLIATGLQSASAFTLLGPFAPWMTARLSYDLNYQNTGPAIGGPMNIGEGYRWNVPVVTYGFDQSFLEFFGSNGVAAVESAVQILNDLPQAAVIDPDAYPLEDTRVNHRAEFQGLIDLKSVTLALFLEQMGLASPSQYTYSLRDYTNQTNYTLLMRNFDPVSLLPSDSVNGTAYAYIIISDAAGTRFDPVEIQIDPAADPYTAVADNHWERGAWQRGLTRDDVGELRYLYRTNNLAMEGLIPGVMGSGTNASNFVTTALRPGVDKILLQRLDFNPLTEQFIPITNVYLDSYITNGELRHQTLQRIIEQPDILFTSKFTGFGIAFRTGTSNWINSGAPGRDGPGTIQGPSTINLNRLCPSDYNLYPSNNYAFAPYVFPLFPIWGSYDGTTNDPVAYPVPLAVTNSTTFHFAMSKQQTWSRQFFTWELSGQPNDLFLLQTSADFTNWLTITTITNLGWDYLYADVALTNTPQRFFRTIKQ